MKNKITEIFIKVFKDQFPDLDTPIVNDDMILLDSGLDSLGFAVLVVELEQQLGFDPFTISDEAFYPSTFGEFVSYYEKFKP